MKQAFTFLIICIFFGAANAQQFPDRHTTDTKSGWVSCTPTESPNKVREESHWIMYDFGNEYTLFQSTLWNVNGYQQTDQGIQDLVIDYSIDGTNWNELDYYTLGEGPASSFYQGESGPDFGGINARYVLITGLTNYGHASCFGLSEVRFQATISTNTNVDDTSLADTQISVSPNPFVEQTTITFDELDAGDYIYDVVDISGKRVQSGEVNISAGSSTFLLTTKDLMSGTYFFKLNYGPLVLTKQLQIAK